MSASSALWWVTNGRAAAPPAEDSSTGVSTSVKPRSTSVERTEATTAERTSKVWRVDGLAIRSRWRSRSRASVSASPRCLSGSARSAFDSSRTSVAATVSSPVCVVITVPATPIQSPRSSASTSSNGLAQRLARNQQLDAPALVGQRAEEQAAVAADQHQPAGDAHARRRSRRPAARPAKRPRRSAAVWSRSNAAGYGSIPRSRSASSFASRCSRSLKACSERAHGRTSEGRPATRSPIAAAQALEPGGRRRSAPQRAPAWHAS